MRMYDKWTEDEKQEWNRYYLNSDNAYQDEIANKAIEIASREPKGKIENVDDINLTMPTHRIINELVNAVNELNARYPAGAKGYYL